MQRKTTGRNRIILLMLLFLPSAVFGADIFQFSAPPGAVYLNSSFESSTVEQLSITVEHEGAAIPAWFIAIDAGTSAGFEPRELVQAPDTMSYQIYKTSPPSSDIIKAPPELLSLSNVIAAADFNAEAAVMEQQTYTIFFSIDSGQFIQSGTYSDTITLYLYTGDYSDSGTHVLAHSVNITVYGRMAELLDIYSIREPGIRFMDLTVNQTGKLIATVNERSNSSTGYTVSISSKNLANDTGGAATPYFLHSSSAGSLSYTLTYDGSAVTPWAAGTAQLTDSSSTTAPEWLSKQLRINYSGSSTLPAGDYEDILTLTISAK